MKAGKKRVCLCEARRLVLLPEPHLEIVCECRVEVIRFTRPEPVVIQGEEHPVIALALAAAAEVQEREQNIRSGQRRIAATYRSLGLRTPPPFIPAHWSVDAEEVRS